MTRRPEIQSATVLCPEGLCRLTRTELLTWIGNYSSLKFAGCVPMTFWAIFQQVWRVRRFGRISLGTSKRRRNSLMESLGLSSFRAWFVLAWCFRRGNDYEFFSKKPRMTHISSLRIERGRCPRKEKVNSLPVWRETGTSGNCPSEMT
jgi:hypothetical protein